MDVFRTKNLATLPDFKKYGAQLAIAERSTLSGGEAFFSQLMHMPFKTIGQVFRTSSVDDIKYILEDEIPHAMQRDPFYSQWVADMAEICEIFCETLCDDAVSFCLTMERGCRRYHVDNVPMRLLVTYAGQGTEWLPDDAVNRRAIASRASNDDLITDPSARRFMNPWDVAIFRGGPKGLLHRTPDSALKKPSILMRLDHSSFWDNILKQQQENTDKHSESASYT